MSEVRVLFARGSHIALLQCFPGDEGYATALLTQGVLLPATIAGVLHQSSSMQRGELEAVCMGMHRDLLGVSLPMIGASGARRRSTL